MRTHEDVNVIRHHGEGVQGMTPLHFTMSAMEGSRRCKGPVRVSSNNRSKAANAFPELIPESRNTRFGGKLPYKRHVTKTG